VATFKTIQVTVASLAVKVIKIDIQTRQKAGCCIGVVANKFALPPSCIMNHASPTASTQNTTKWRQPRVYHSFSNSLQAKATILFRQFAPRVVLIDLCVCLCYCCWFGLFLDRSVLLQTTKAKKKPNQTFPTRKSVLFYES